MTSGTQKGSLSDINYGTLTFPLAAVRKWQRTCIRCGHVFNSDKLKETDGKLEPKRCWKCGSQYWNTPYTRGKPKKEVKEE